MYRGFDTRAQAASEAIAALSASVRDPLELLDEVRRRIARVVPNAGGAWMLTDPETIIPVSLVKDRAASEEMGRRLVEHELLVPDFVPFSDLHRRGVTATTLHRATAGRPELSPRYRDIEQPAGLGAELRLLFRAGSATWGMACVSREAGESDFSDDELTWLRGIAPVVGHGLRSAIARRPLDETGPWAPGMLVLTEDGTVEYTTGDAKRWLSALPTGPGYQLLASILVVALQVRSEALSSVPAYEVPAHARVRVPSGWLHIHAAALRDASGQPTRIAVMLEPADRAQLLPLLARVHGLTEREREVTELIVTGLPTEEIAQRMSISRHTVRDYCKSIFAKFGVVSRPELTARFLPELV